MPVTRHSSSRQPHFTRSPFHFCWPEADGSGGLRNQDGTGQQEVWSTNGDGVALTLKLSDAGREAVGGKRKASAKKETKAAAGARSDTNRRRSLRC
jgi:hypothetical protein